MPRKKPPPAAWQVDPAWPAVPPETDDDATTREADAEPLVTALQRRLTSVLVEARRLSLALHKAQRAANPPPPTPSADQRRPGNPGHPARNDRLLELFEQTPLHLPRLQRCRMAAQRYAIETNAARFMPATTARDAIAEARRRRDGTP